MTELDQNTCWSAVKSRDKAFDGHFFYGVLTTGIFCRPSCPSRCPNLENVRFFKNPEGAIKAGFRACLKCHPTGETKEEKLVKDMHNLARFIEAKSNEPLSLKILAEKVGLSLSAVQRSFKKTIGLSPKEYQSAVRFKFLKSSLREGDDITGAIFEAGFGSTSRVYEQINGRIGMTPSAYRAGGAGEKISYAFRKTNLGNLLMAATDRGVCFVHFGETKEALEKVLRAEYPNADLERSISEKTEALDLWIEALNNYISKGTPRPDFPLHLNGTAFQIRVWRFLMTVKEGQVISYSEVAKKIGKPKATRAVANACAANNIGILVPCHRVLRGDGALGGYRWGMERKRALIDAERAHSLNL